MLMLCRFFDYKSPDYHGEDLFGIAHIIFMVLVTIALVVVPWLLRRVTHQKIHRYLQVMAILMFVWEGVKIIWESSYYIPEHGHFEWDGLLPLYLCSMFIFVLPFAGYGRGLVQRSALGFLCSLGILGGLSNLYMPSILNQYPFFSYATFVSLIYHALMAFTGIWLLVSGYFKPERKDMWYGFIPTICFSILVIPTAYILQAQGYDNDYMLYLHALGVPGLQNIADWLVSKGLQGLVTVMMFLLFWGLTALIIAMILLIKKGKNKHDNKANHKADQRGA